MFLLVSVSHLVSWLWSSVWKVSTDTLWWPRVDQSVKTCECHLRNYQGRCRDAYSSRKKRSSMVRSVTFWWIGARKSNIENNLNAEDLLDGSTCVPRLLRWRAVPWRLNPRSILDPSTGFARAASASLIFPSTWHWQYIYTHSHPKSKLVSVLASDG